MAKAINHGSKPRKQRILDLTAEYKTALGVVASGECSDADVSNLFIIEDRITAIKHTTDRWVRLKLLVTLRQILTAYVSVSDSAPWGQMAREIEALGG